MSEQPKYNNEQINYFKSLFSSPLFNTNMFNNDEIFQNLRKNYLYTIYRQEKLNLESAPKRFEDAERNYYTFQKGDTWYNNFKEEQYAKVSKKATDKMISEFKQDKKQLIDVIHEYDSLMIYQKNMKELKDTHLKENEKLKSNIKKLKNEENMNRRKAVYHERSVEKNEKRTHWLKYLYWILLIVLIIVVLLIKRDYKNKNILITIIALMVMPYFISVILKIIDFTKIPNVSLNINEKENIE